jgi:uridine phosphorylase
METCVINPERKKGEPQLPPGGILAVNPGDAATFPALAETFGLRRHFLFHSNLYSSDRLFFAGPAVGAPMAVMVLEKLIALGAETIVVYGWAGSLQKDLHAMDILVPDSGLSEEGTSSHYASKSDEVARPDSELHRALCLHCAEQQIAARTGRIWTTDAPYRETRAKVEAYSRQAICGVDMEFTALCTAARFRGVRLAGLMLVSDELLRHPWTPHYPFKVFRKKSADMLELLCGFIRDNRL